jgi:hypothetical protein
MSTNYIVRITTNHQGRDRSRIGDLRNSYKIFVGKTGRMIQLGRDRRRWEYNMKTRLKMRKVVAWLGSRGQGRDFVNMVMNLRVP